MRQITLFFISLLQFICLSKVYHLLNQDSPILKLDMEDGDVIDACRAMSGGLRANQRQWSYMLFDHNGL